MFKLKFFRSFLAFTFIIFFGSFTLNASNNEKYIGRVLKVFIEGKLPEDGVFIGRTYRDTPSVDGFIFVNSDTELVSGQFVDVEVTGYDEYDLIGDVKLWI